MAQARTAAEVKEYIAKMARDEEITQAEAEAKLIRFGIHRRNATVNYQKANAKPRKARKPAAKKSAKKTTKRAGKKSRSSLLD